MVNELFLTTTLLLFTTVGDLVNKSVLRYHAFVSLLLFRILSAFMGFWTACNIFHFLELTDFDWHLIVYMQCVLTQPFRTRIGF